MGQSPDSVPTPGDSSEPNLLSLPQDELAMGLKKELEPGEYNIFVKLTDSQGKAQVTQVKAQVCECEGTAKNCERRSYIVGGLGVPAILGILGGILALLSEYGVMGMWMGLLSPRGPDAMPSARSPAAAAAALCPATQSGEGAVAAARG